MRSSEDEEGTVSAIFEDDVPPGGVLISCGACGFPQIDTSEPDTPCFCMGCGVELFYRPCYEW